MTDSRWVVVHYGARDHYELPLALAEQGKLDAFVTDWYTPLDRLPGGLEKLQTRWSDSLRGRFRPGLSSRLVRDEKIRWLCRRAIQRLHPSWSDRKRSDQHLGTRAGTIASTNSANIFSTSYYGESAFRSTPRGAKALFQIHPQPRFLRDLYEGFIQENSLHAGLRDEHEMRCDEAELQSWETESQLADRILAASTFTRRSLTECGIAAERIRVVPYGVDHDEFRPSAQAPTGPFTVLFVGSKIARKGLGLLLQCWRDLRPSGARLVIAGGGGRDETLLESFPPIYEEVRKVDRQDLIRLYQSADLMVLPSLAEGFGHAYLEALACGTPVVGTFNSGAADLVTHGENGFVLEAGDHDALASQLDWALSRPASIRQMRSAAADSARPYSWARFRSQVWENLQDL